MPRRKFSREFKIEAVRLVTERGVAVTQAARDLDLAEGQLRRWMQELTAAPQGAFPGNGQQRADRAEIAALKKEVAKLKAESDILKKSRSLFREVNSPKFSRRPRFAFCAAVRTRRVTASRSVRASGSGYRTSRCSRTRPGAPQPLSDRLFGGYAHA